MTAAKEEVKEVRSVQSGAFAWPRRKLSLTPELFGKLLVLSWARKFGRERDLADRDTIVQELLSAAETAPESVRLVMHIEDRITGQPSIAEYTQYMVAAQDNGLVKRYNPAYVRCRVEVEQNEAEELLSSYADDFASELAWLNARVANIAEKQYHQQE